MEEGRKQKDREIGRGRQIRTGEGGGDGAGG